MNIQAQTAAELKKRLIAATKAGRKAEIGIIAREVARRAALHAETQDSVAACNRIADRLLRKEG